MLSETVRGSIRGEFNSLLEGIKAVLYPGDFGQLTGCYTLLEEALKDLKWNVLSISQIL